MRFTSAYSSLNFTAVRERMHKNGELDWGQDVYNVAWTTGRHLKKSTAPPLTRGTKIDQALPSINILYNNTRVDPSTNKQDLFKTESISILYFVGNSSERSTEC
jgi:hypothetical protein